MTDKYEKEFLQKTGKVAYKIVVLSGLSQKIYDLDYIEFIEQKNRDKKFAIGLSLMLIAIVIISIFLVSIVK